MRHGWLILTMLLAGCGGGGSAPAVQPSASAVPTVVAAPEAPRREIGSVSGLSAQTSPLTGSVTGFAIERTAFGTRVQLAADTLFEFDQATLTPAAQSNIARTGDLARQGGAGTITVTGYTDAKGEDAYNLTLSRRRAETVVAALRALPGLADRSFAAVGKGEADPVAANAAADGSDDPVGRAKNRRVTVDIPK